jgi:hypothetical protein
MGSLRDTWRRLAMTVRPQIQRALDAAARDKSSPDDDLELMWYMKVDSTGDPNQSLLIADALMCFSDIDRSIR